MFLSKTTHFHTRIRRIAGALLSAVAAVWFSYAMVVPDRIDARRPVPQRATSSLAIRLDRVRLVDYFPSPASWSAMWTRWDAGVLARDFARIRALGANAVRLTIAPSALGFPMPAAVMQRRLAETIALAGRSGLDVQLTLFDQFRAWGDVTGSEEWTKALLSPYRNDDRVAFVDLRNELDPERPDQVAWARTLLPYAEQIAGTVPVTVSKSDAGGAAGFCRLRDSLAPARPAFWDVHFYGVEGLAYSYFAAVSRCAAPQPVFVGETGQSTYPDGRVNGLPISTAAYEAYQEYYLRVVARAAAAAQLPAVAPWILQDLDPAGAPPQRRPAEYSFGLLRRDGSPKPAASTVAGYFEQGIVSSDFDGGFEQAVPDALGRPFPALWRLPRSNGSASIVRDGAVARTGTASLRMSSTGGSAGSLPGAWVVPVDASLVPGQPVSASVWARGSAATGTTTLSISYFDAAGVYVGQDSSAPLPDGDSGWTLLRAAGVAPAGAAYVRLYLKSGHNSGSVWFDDVGYAAAG